MKPLILFSLITVFFSLSACSISPIVNNTDSYQNSDVKKTDSDTRELQDFDLEKDTLYDLLIAEIAAQRNQFTITLLNYIQQARMTRDPEVVRRAINAAQLTKDVEAIHEMALLWLDIEPDSIPAHQLLALQYSLQKQYADAMSHIEAILTLGGEARVESLAIGSQSLDDKEKNELLGLYHSLYEKFPDNMVVGYSYALVLRNLKQYDDSLATLDKVLQNNPDYEAAVVLRTNILYDQGKLKEAIDYADDKFDEFPKNHNLGRFFASMLIEDKQLNHAETVFKTLMDEYPQAPSLKLSHALVMLENNKVDEAKTEFLELLADGVHRNEANFYLGRIADKAEDSEKAIYYYEQVTSSIHFEPSIERISFLLAKNGKKFEMINRLVKLRQERPKLTLKLWQLEFKLLSAFNYPKLAKESLTQALEEFPDDEQFLYIRAMNFEAEDDLAGMEKDLRHIIQNDPENSIAINALGYTLADRTDRLQEALTLIQQALSITPNNPAILDSMGWVLFKLHKREDALIFLLKAFENYQDGEVAAHLGEVLWSLNQKTEAKELWGKMLLMTPSHESLLKVIKQFAPELLEQAKNTTTGSEDEPNNNTDNMLKQTDSGSNL